MYKNLLFDLDGTLLDTLTDIRAALNDAMVAAGLPFEYSKAKVKTFLGYGTSYLVHKALADLDNDDNYNRLMKEYMVRYAEYQIKHTKPFNGMPETLGFLKDKGIKLFVCTNKPHPLAEAVMAATYPDDLFGEIRGHEEPFKRKPDPEMVDYLVEKYSLNKEETLFVGDSPADLETAQNTGLDVCICLWGYAQYKQKFLEQCQFVIKHPKELVGIVL